MWESSMLGFLSPLSCNCMVFLISSSFYSSVATYSYSFFFSWVACWALPSASEVLCVASVPVGGCHLSPLVTVHVCAAGKFHRRTCPQLSVIRTWIWHQLWGKKIYFWKMNRWIAHTTCPSQYPTQQFLIGNQAVVRAVWFWKERTVKIILGDCENAAPLAVSFWRMILYLIRLSMLTC